MPDVFISYAREDRDRASLLAEALSTRGWSVWWDRKMVAGQTFDETIERHLEASGSVVVLWSEHSVTSEWVRNEAGVASERDVLVPALIDNVKQPLEFRRRHAANLTGWTGDLADPEFQALCDGIAAKMKSPADRLKPLPPPVRRTRSVRSIAVMAVLIFLAGMAAYGIWRAMAGGTDSADRIEVVNAPPSQAGPDEPMSLAPGTVYRLGLAPNQEYYFRLPDAVEGVKVVLDMRRIDNRVSNLQSRLALVDQNGAAIEERLITFNEIDVGARKIATWSTRQSARVGFRLLNGNSAADFWLNVRRAPASGFVPLFGSVTPQPLPIENEASGLLDVNQDVYYTTSLRQGDHQVTVDFANAERRHTNIQGSFALLDGEGGDYRQLVRFNEIDVSHRKVEPFLVKGDGPVIFRVQNTNHAVRYTVRITRLPDSR